VPVHKLLSDTICQFSKTRLTICRCPGVIITPISIIADVSGPEDTVQKPECHPIGRMLSIRLSVVEQPALVGASSCLMPSFHDSLTASIGANVVPEEWCLRCLVISLLFYEAGSICIDFIVHSNSLVLCNTISTNDQRNELWSAHSHGAIQPFMLRIVGVKVESFHELVLGNPRTNGCDSRHFCQLDDNGEIKSKPESMCTGNTRTKD
jgi:hypothetical protein